MLTLNALAMLAVIAAIALFIWGLFGFLMGDQFTRTTCLHLFRCVVVLLIVAALIVTLDRVLDQLPGILQGT
jgi:hypothetical protein